MQPVDSFLRGNADGTDEQSYFLLDYDVDELRQLAPSIVELVMEYVR